MSKIFIVGAGPAGLSMACALANTAVDITIIDLQSPEVLSGPKPDGRAIAMTHLSQSILKEYGVWQRIPQDSIYPIKEAKVFNAGQPYALHFERTDDVEAPLGHFIPNHLIRQALYQQVSQQDNVTFCLGQKVVEAKGGRQQAQVILENGRELEADLLIVADSRFSPVRRLLGVSAAMKDFGRVMMVTDMKHSQPHHHVASENFYYGKTCAILPLNEHRSSVVITLPATLSNELQALDKPAFAREVEKMLTHRLGQMTVLSDTVSYPLIGCFADQFVGERFALVGDAAVGMHPVTAHGFNLGLRSADTLATQIMKALNKGQDVGAASVLWQYQLRHRLLARPLYEGTNLIVKLYNNERPLAKLMRPAALRLANRLPLFRQLVTGHLTHSR